MFHDIIILCSFLHLILLGTGISSVSHISIHYLFSLAIDNQP